MFLNDIRNVFDIPWNAEGITYGQVRRREEYEHSVWSFREADPVVLRRQFEEWEAEAQRLLVRMDGEEAAPLVVPAHESVLKCSHLFNVLDARGALSVTERAAMIQRIRKLACRGAAAYVAQREAMGFPLLRTAEAR
jgi:glycyl-tRNA synthetase alpha chain